MIKDLTFEELTVVNGGGAYETGKEHGEYVGELVGDFLIIVAIGSLFLL